MKTKRGHYFVFGWGATEEMKNHLQNFYLNIKRVT